MTRKPAFYRLLGFLLIVGTFVPVSDADETSLTVEQLVEQVKPSIVVVTFSGREGGQLGLGSGFIIDSGGLIATNLHVIGEARPITVRTHDGKKYPVVEVYATDRTHDLAILRVEAEGLPELTLGDSDTLKQGQSVIALGNPLGLEHSVVQGVVSGLREDVDGRPMIQLAIPIEKGNSGGPMLDMQGRVHGLLTLKSQVTDNLGYAAPVNDLKPMLDQPNPVPMSRWLTIGTLNPRLWDVRDNVQWRQRAGRILVDGRGRGFGGRTFVLSKQEIPEQPYEVAVTVRMDEQDGAAGLIFHADGGERHYGFYPSSGKLRFTRFDGPDVYSWKVLGEKEIDAYRKEDWNRLKVRVADGQFQCFCNEELVFESTDMHFSKGQAGLAKFRHTTAEFKQFAVANEVRGDSLSAEKREALEKLVVDIPIDTAPTEALVDRVLAQTESQAAGSILNERARQLERQAARLRELAQAVQAESVVQQLSELFEPTEDETATADVDLVHAALLLAAIDNSELDIDGYREQVNEMANELRTLILDDPSETEKMEALHDYLFREMGYHGSRTNYHNASNSYLNEVIDDREGLPITLSLLYMELARRIDLTVDGVGLPGHFVVGVHLGNDSTQLVDVFDRGSLMTLDAAKERVISLSGRPWIDEYLAPYTEKQIIVRMLRNLLGVANGKEDPEAALRYVNALLALEPDSAQDRLFRAVLCYNTSRVEQGLRDVDWVLEHEPEGIDLRRVEQLRGLLNRMVSN